MQNLENKYRLRVKYVKMGKYAFLSHLEILKYLQYLIRRCNLPFMVTNGFSPHMKISFGNALPVGIESKNEAFDIYLYEYIDKNELLLILQKNSVDELKVIDCNYVDLKETSISAIYNLDNYVVNAEFSGYEIPNSINDKNINDYVSNLKIEEDNIEFSIQNSANGSLNPLLFLKTCFKNIKIKKIIKL